MVLPSSSADSVPQMSRVTKKSFIASVVISTC